MRFLSTAFLGLLLAFAHPLNAQELKTHATPFTAWLDLQQSGSKTASLPIWLESVAVETAGAPTTPESTTFRIRLRRFGSLTDELLLRLFFTDSREHRPSVSAWSDTGRNTFPSRTLGSGIGLPTSESLVIPAADADYIEIKVRGNGSSVSAALLSSLGKAETRRAIDFGATPAVADPFDAAAPAVPAGNDSFLFGRVKATLEAVPFQLAAGGENATEFVFDLESKPVAAVLTFEVLNADVARPPELSVNGFELGSGAFSLPDLADPGYRGSIMPGHRDVVFHYSGWLKCQKLIPGSSLRSGSNTITVRHGGGQSAPVAIRAVEVQLKYEEQLSPTP